MFNYIMGLIDKAKQKPRKQPKQPIEFTLGTDEIRIILEGIQNSTYKGKDIEMMYNLVLKLQDLYQRSLNDK